MPTHSWKSFKDYIDDLSADRRSLLFRGQSRAEWGLVSTYHRLASPGEPANYWKALYVVHDYICTWSGRTWNLADTFDVASFLGFLQHNGFPTPLLDWTRSPYAAAYFAFAGVSDSNPTSDEVAVFAFDHRAWSTDWNQIYDVWFPGDHVSVLQSQSRGNHKQLLQQGAYTFSTVRDQAEHIEAYEAAFQRDHGDPKKYIEKHLLSVQEKPTVMHDLGLMGISAMTLFPGVEGVCRHLAEALFPAPQVGLTPSQRNAVFEEVLQRILDERPGGGPIPDPPQSVENDQSRSEDQAQAADAADVIGSGRAGGPTHRERA